MNPYNNKLETYKTTTLSNLGPGEQVATLLNSAAKIFIQRMRLC